MRRRTKIVCTLGPAVDSREKIQQLINAGMNLARLNCSHGDWETKERWIEWIRELSPKHAPVGILADLQGPKFRIGMLPEAGLVLRAGDHITVGHSCQIPINQNEILDAMAAGDRLLLGDGEIEFNLLSGKDGVFEAKVVSGGVLKSRKGVTLVGKAFAVPAMTDQDRADVERAIELNCDFIALSYVKHAEDITMLRDLIALKDKSIGICAKIETPEAIKDLIDIVEAVDLVMVARGDMGLQMDLEDVPLHQKKIIEASNQRGIPVITATQMLESMIQNPRPTRAEATDVFNAILDGTDAVMLSGETAAGAYPIDCVKTMSRICEAAEAVFDRGRIERDFKERARGHIPATDAIAHAVSDLARLLKPSAILCNSTSGQTPRLVSKFRPKMPILCATRSERTQRKLSVVWGVEAYYIPSEPTMDEMLMTVLETFRSKKRIKDGDLVVMTAGVPMGTPGNTNLIQLHRVGSERVSAEISGTDGGK
jgi:pyruvate kinase